MREIKFRAWEHNLKEMIPVDDIQFYRGDDIEVDGLKLKPKPRNEQSIMINTRSAWRIADGEDVTLMQYTGLKDKNGKEIYEGDVVEYLERGMKNCVGIGQVTWNKDGWNVEGFYDGSQDEPGRAFSENAQLEIIGNVWENPELIEK